MQGSPALILHVIGLAPKVLNFDDSLLFSQPITCMVLPSRDFGFSYALLVLNRLACIVNLFFARIKQTNCATKHVFGYSTLLLIVAAAQGIYY